MRIKLRHMMKKIEHAAPVLAAPDNSGAAAPTYPKPESDQRKKKRIGAKLDKALRAIVFEGMKIGEAAEHAGMSRQGLSVALKREHVKAYRSALHDAHRAEIHIETLHTGVHLMRKSKSDKVRLAAAIWLEEKTGGAGAPTGGQTTNILMDLRGNGQKSPLITVDHVRGVVKVQEFQGDDGEVLNSEPV